MRGILFLSGWACLLVVLAGCGGSAHQRAHGAAALTVTDFAGREVRFAEKPIRIVALSNGETNIIYALGGELVGRPASTTPLADEAAERVTQIGTAHEVDLEKIALLHPDVVLGNDPMNVKDIPMLEGIGAKVVLTSANSIDEIKRQIALFGQLLGREEKAVELVGGIEAEEGRLSAASAESGPRALLVYGAPGTFMAALPSSLGGDILEAAGGYNIASDFPRLQSYPQYAQLNAERIVEADPQVIFIMTHGSPEEVEDSFRKEMQNNAAWKGVQAVKNGRVEVLPSDLFGSSPGSRIVEALRLMRDKLASVSSERSDE
ncbi:ABC transporter substrate-binding protein [Cohnella thermotolerans]|uniref:ABC transporter substrate-binding protein n=1 Tax=Cohnella thermotolerans TaxID=329858 RepID=UPI00047D20CE|nr:ABC transporter substrate-binding protein [Cohnella thermotolerans]